MQTVVIENRVRVDARKAINNREGYRYLGRLAMMKGRKHGPNPKVRSL